MDRKKGVSIFVKLFVGFHALAITVWSLPNPRQPIMKGTVEPFGAEWLLFYNTKHLKQTPWSPIRFYTVTLGNWQSWDMFAPNPATTDLWGNAEVVYRDGSVRTYPYYRIYDLPLPTKYFRERFRKFFERASDSRFSFAWGPFAQRVAREMDTQPDNPPVKVRLYRYTQSLRGPGKPVADYESRMYYEHEVDLASLRSAEGRS